MKSKLRREVDWFTPVSKMVFKQLKKQGLLLHKAQDGKCWYIGKHRHYCGIVMICDFKYNQWKAKKENKRLMEAHEIFKRMFSEETKIEEKNEKIER